jgi:hypothetical protein
MNTGSLRFVLAVSLLTALTTAGSILAFFLLMSRLEGPLMTHIPRAGVNAILFFLLLTVGLGGGGLWGAGLARVMSAEVKKLTQAGALTWGATVAVTGLVLGLSQIPLAAIDRVLQVRDHYLFLAAFVPAVGAAAAVDTRVMTGRLGFVEFKNAAARNAGTAAALGFFATSLVLMYAFGWEVNGPRAGRDYSMVTIMLLCNLGAALAGGAAMGWTLARAQASAPTPLHAVSA